MKNVILYRARCLTPTVEREIERLSRDLPEFDLFVVCYLPEYDLARDSDPGRVYCYGQRDLHTLPYPGKLCSVDWENPDIRPQQEMGNGKFFRNMEPGQHDLPILRFFLDRPHFDRYWVIEDDVRCSGPWSDIFGELAQSKADLLMTVVQRYAENPRWKWWPFLVTGGEQLPARRLVKGFTPFCRLSAACLQAIDEKYRQSWGGHYEVSWPTIACGAGLSIEDIGGKGSYTPRKRRGRFYSSTNENWSLFPGTFIFRPAFCESGDGEFGKDITPQTMLWHPVRERA